MSFEVRFFVHIGGRSYPAVKFSGCESISSPYSFDIDFQPDKPVSADILNTPCALEICRGGRVNRYGGVVGEVRTRESLDTEDDGSAVRCSIRLVPRISLLSLNFTTRIFKKMTAVEIIEKVVADAGLGGYFRFKLDSGRKRMSEEYCVQYQETDLNFISRLMERHGIWYYFESAAASPEWKERVIVTDRFSEFPSLGGELRFIKSSGQTEVSESITSLSTRNALMPKSVATRAYNYRTPDNFPESKCELVGGQSGSVYEYGGAFKNLDDAQRGAELRAKRLVVENQRMDGESNGVMLRAGTLVSIVHPDDQTRSGAHLLVSVEHAGGWDRKADSYKNKFSCVNAARQIYAPPLTAAQPFVGGLVTAPVDGLGDDSPTLDELGRYRVKLPYDIADSEKYCASKDIRLAQLSGGKGYGVHFPSKRGAEMVLAYVNGNPDKPLGLGFVPNADAQSVVHSGNKFTNVVRSWGGGELLIDDTPGKQKVKLSSHKGRYIELHDGRKQAALRSALSELLFSDCTLQAILAAGGHTIHLNFLGDGFISLTTARKHKIEINDKEGTISLRSANGSEALIDDKGDSITLSDSAGKNKIVVDGADKGALRLKSSGNINMEADGNISIKAGGGVFVNGAEVKIASVKDGVQIAAAAKLEMEAKNITQQAAEKMETRGKEVKVEGQSKVGVKGKNVTIADGAVTLQKKSAAKEEKPKAAEKKTEAVEKKETAAPPPVGVLDGIPIEAVVMAGESAVNMINTKNTGNAKTERNAAGQDGTGTVSESGTDATATPSDGESQETTEETQSNDELYKPDPERLRTAIRNAVKMINNDKIRTPDCVSPCKIDCKTRCTPNASSECKSDCFTKNNKKCINKRMACNMSVREVFHELTDSNELDNKLANKIYEHLAGTGASPPSPNFKEVKIGEVQALANQGHIVIGALKASGNGHVVIIAPGREEFGIWYGNGGYNKNKPEENITQKTVPVVMDTGPGRREISMPISKGYGPDAHKDVKFFHYTKIK